MYIIITPVKNEASNLVKLSRLVKSQTVKPLLWLVVDDSSVDSTPHVIKDLEKSLEFVRAIRLSIDSIYDPVNRYGIVVRLGIKYIEKNAELKYITKEAKFLGILDSDIFIPKDYYERNIRVLEAINNLGIVSGLYLEAININEMIKLKPVPIIIGGAMIFRKECLNSIGGFPAYPQPDVAAIIKARKKGWSAGINLSTYAVHLRPRRALKSYVMVGSASYRLGHNPALYTLSTIRSMIRERSFKYVGRIIGFFSSLIRGDARYRDSDIYSYFSTEKLYAKMRNTDDILRPSIFSINTIGNIIWLDLTAIEIFNKTYIMEESRLFQ